MIVKPGYAGVTFEFPEGTIIADIGFGHDPVRGATYYIDRDVEESADRGGRAAVQVPADKFIAADVSNGIPLQNKSCDFVVASHIAEHMDDPKFFCNELSRVGKTGYIETPGILQELYECKAVHKWFVTKFRGRLIFIRKRGLLEREWKLPLVFPLRVLLYLFRQTCYHWSGNIRCIVID